MEPLKERAGSQKRYGVIMNLRTGLLKLWSAGKRESASPGSLLQMQIQRPIPDLLIQMSGVRNSRTPGLKCFHKFSRWFSRTLNLGKHILWQGD